ncbi:hypothetical protein AMATHDRAFT_43928 [Amanita thiersii Skay4041]|uniref:Autophagy-related protein 27 n=1 Tax=Amanita thiersii Skay4041 TaxID=703135 RepID=A0A2A9NC49_9AGAR|nr:hypothetical protein AMATHDRAFT_43928 [Amanita thiersii Skay4041]
MRPWYSVTFLLLIVPFSQAIAAGLPCKISIRKRRYNLCPLFGGGSQEQASSNVYSVMRDETTPPTHTRYHYAISLSAADGVPWDNTLPADLQCPRGTWICLTVINTRPNHPSEPERILSVVPVSKGDELDPKVKLLDEEVGGNPILQLVLHGGQYMNQKQKAVFQFSCDRSELEGTIPNYLWNWNGTHTFTWASQYACPSFIDTPDDDDKKGPGDPDPDPPENPPIDEDDGESLSHGHRTEIWMWFFLCSLFTCVVL